MSACHVRVELKNTPANASFEQKERAFRGMFAAFKRKVNDSGILTEVNMRANFESRGQKNRRKKKESQQRRMKELQGRLRQHFGDPANSRDEG